MKMNMLWVMSDLKDSEAFSDIPLKLGHQDFSIFACELGRRLRNARLNKNFSRRELSKLSNVSTRHLAHLELGSANISIALLYRVALALELDINRMLSFLGYTDSVVNEVAERFSNASQEQQSDVLTALGINQIKDASKSSRVALVGVRGGGKTTLGNALASHFDVPFVEVSNEIKALSGISVSEVIELYGMDGFRRYEHKAITNNKNIYSSVVLAVGGGIVESSLNLRLLLKNYTTVWVKARADEHISRVRAQGDERPMQGFLAAREHLQSLLEMRRQYFDYTDFVLDTSMKSVRESIEEVIELASVEKFFDE